MRSIPLAGLLAAALLALAGAAGAESFSGLKPAQPQPDEAALQQGLAVEYTSRMVRHVDPIENASSWRKGPPLKHLNWHSGTGAVLTSGQPDGVGARITGYIRLAEPGRHLFAVQSNDGVRLRLAGTVIIEDPDVHADRFSDLAEVMVEEPGWYDLNIIYFERKNTSTLELHWQPPGKEEFEIVPAELLAHLPQ